LFFRLSTTSDLCRLSLVTSYTLRIFSLRAKMTPIPRSTRPSYGDAIFFLSFSGLALTVGRLRNPRSVPGSALPLLLPLLTSFSCTPGSVLLVSFRYPASTERSYAFPYGPLFLTPPQVMRSLAHGPTAFVKKCFAPLFLPADYIQVGIAKDRPFFSPPPWHLSDLPRKTGNTLFFFFFFWPNDTNFIVLPFVTFFGPSEPPFARSSSPQPPRIALRMICPTLTHLFPCTFLLIAKRRTPFTRRQTPKSRIFFSPPGSLARNPWPRPLSASSLS